MPRHAYPTVAEALAIHEELVREFGGSPVVRDLGRLEAAIFRPQIGYYEGLVEEAAALMESLANNHPFLDGNKRVSFAVTDVFLRLNGFYLDVDPLKADGFIRGAMQRREFRFPKILEWLKKSVRQLPS